MTVPHRYLLQLRTEQLNHIYHTHTSPLPTIEIGNYAQISLHEYKSGVVTKLSDLMFHQRKLYRFPNILPENAHQHNVD